MGRCNFWILSGNTTYGETIGIIFWGQLRYCEDFAVQGFVCIFKFLLLRVPVAVGVPWLKLGILGLNIIFVDISGSFSLYRPIYEEIGKISWFVGLLGIALYNGKAGGDDILGKKIIGDLIEKACFITASGVESDRGGYWLTFFLGRCKYLFISAIATCCEVIGEVKSFWGI